MGRYSLSKIYFTHLKTHHILIHLKSRYLFRECTLRDYYDLFNVTTEPGQLSVEKLGNSMVRPKWESRRLDRQWRGTFRENKTLQCIVEEEFRFTWLGRISPKDVEESGNNQNVPLFRTEVSEVVSRDKRDSVGPVNNGWTSSIRREFEVLSSPGQTRLLVT